MSSIKSKMMKMMKMMKKSLNKKKKCGKKMRVTRRNRKCRGGGEATEEQKRIREIFKPYLSVLALGKIAIFVKGNNTQEQFYTEDDIINKLTKENFDKNMLENNKEFFFNIAYTAQEKGFTKLSNIIIEVMGKKEFDNIKKSINE